MVGSRGAVLQVVIGLGSNLGDRQANLEAALARLADVAWVRVLATSPVYESAPLGPPQGHYLNAAALLEVDRGLRELLDHALVVEQDMGRERRVRWGPRIIDVDLLWSDAPEVHGPKLTVPHPELTRRDFALVPTLEVLGDRAPAPLRAALSRLEVELTQVAPALLFSGAALAGR